RQSSKLPSICRIRAPCSTACAILPSAILPCGTSTAVARPARAAYADADAEVLPVEAQMTALSPLALACVMATVIPRSLNDPVGFAPSTLRYTDAPVSSDRCGAGSNGVLPSPSVTTSAPSGIGIRDEYALMIPGQPAFTAPLAPTAPTALSLLTPPRLPHASHSRPRARRRACRSHPQWTATRRREPGA